MNIDVNELSVFIEEKKTVRNRVLNPGNYKNLNLSGLRADDVTVENAILSDMVLDRANIRNARIRRTIFENAVISNTVLRLCELEQVSLNNADLNGAALENCKAQGCSFEKVKFVGVSLVDSDFNRASFKGADLSSTDASFCNMRGVDFRGAKLIKTKFCDADLRGADFTGAHLEEVDFRGANIEGALFDKGFNKAQGRDETDMLAAIVDPVARNIIKTATEKKLFNEKQAAAELDSVMKSLFGVDKTKSSEAGLNIEIENVMASVAGAGIGPLMDALQQQEGEPPEAVKKLIEDLIKRGNFPENTTTEDLLSSLLGVVGKK